MLSGSDFVLHHPAWSGAGRTLEPLIVKSTAGAVDGQKDKLATPPQNFSFADVADEKSASGTNPAAARWVL